MYDFLFLNESMFSHSKALSSSQGLHVARDSSRVENLVVSKLDPDVSLEILRL